MANGEGEVESSNWKPDNFSLEVRSKSKTKGQNISGPAGKTENKQTMFQNKALRHDVKDAIACYLLIRGTHAWPLQPHPYYHSMPCLQLTGEGKGGVERVRSKDPGTSIHVVGV